MKITKLTILNGIIIIALSLALFYATSENQRQEGKFSEELQECEERVDRLNFNFDQCAQNPMTGRVECRRCKEGRCMDVYVWFERFGLPEFIERD